MPPFSQQAFSRVLNDIVAASGKGLKRTAIGAGALAGVGAGVGTTSLLVGAGKKAYGLGKQLGSSVRNGISDVRSKADHYGKTLDRADKMLNDPSEMRGPLWKAVGPIAAPGAGALAGMLLAPDEEDENGNHRSSFTNKLLGGLAGGGLGYLANEYGPGLYNSVANGFSKTSYVQPGSMHGFTTDGTVSAVPGWAGIAAPAAGALAGALLSPTDDDEDTGAKLRKRLIGALVGGGLGYGGYALASHLLQQPNYVPNITGIYPQSDVSPESRGIIDKAIHGDRSLVDPNVEKSISGMQKILHPNHPQSSRVIPRFDTGIAFGNNAKSLGNGFPKDQPTLTTGGAALPADMLNRGSPDSMNPFAAGGSLFNGRGFNNP